MRRSQPRRSSDERVAALEKKIADLKAKQLEREKKDDPVLREVRKLQKRLKEFIQLAYDNNRPDLANSALGFRSMLERTLDAELATPRERQVEEAEEEP